MRRFWFYVREGIGAFARSGIMGMLTVFAFFILGTTTILLLAAEETLDQAQERLLALFELEAYLQPGAEQQADSLAEVLRRRGGVEEVKVVGKERAAELFAEEYGEELFDLLGENPLPASLRIRYNPTKISRGTLDQEALEIGKLDGIEEVVFEGDLLARLESVIQAVRNKLFFIAGIIAAVSLLLTLQAVRVSARAVERWVRAVTIIGGSAWQVQAPFLVAGTISGVLGGGLGIGLILILQQVFQGSGGIVPAPDYFRALLALLAMGMIGFFAALIAAPRGVELKRVA